MKPTFNNVLLRRLPLDTEKDNFVRQVSGACMSLVKPTPVSGPSLVALSPSALQKIGVSPRVAAAANALLTDSNTTVDPEVEGDARSVNEAVLRYLSGNSLMDGSQPASHCYCGHQFGNFAGQLGDGAAIYLGEVAMDAGNPSLRSTVIPSSAAGTGRWELQLKGAGLTPYSRTADGRKVLRSSLREFLCSEYMHAIGIPTTRAASLITSDSFVERDPLYTGSVVRERCTVISRVAETFVRFGSFEICKPGTGNGSRAGPSAGNTAPALALFDYVAEELSTPLAADAKRRHPEEWRPAAAESIFAEIVAKTARLVAGWMAAGWCHGVLNTDNMSIVGLTIDYGPFAFLGHYDDDHVSNQSDNSGRYSFRNQPAMCKWNLERLAEAWIILFPTLESRLPAIIRDRYDDAYSTAYRQLMRRKLGLVDAAIDDAAADSVVSEINFALARSGADMTATYHALLGVNGEVGSDLPPDQRHAIVDSHLGEVAARIAATCITVQGRIDIIKRRLPHLRSNIHPTQIEQLLQVAAVDPSRLKHVFQGSINPDAIIGFLTEEHQKVKDAQRLQGELKELFGTGDEAKTALDTQHWMVALRAYHECLSNYAVDKSERVAAMRAANPVFVLTPWVLQQAIDRAESSSFGLVRSIAERMMTPFAPDARDGVLWSMKPPPDAHNICVSCSS